MKDQIRWDGLGMLRVERTPEGFLKGHVVVTRSGIFNYMQPDGSVMRELRHPNDVFDSRSLDTMKLVPIVMDHPAPDPVTGSRLVNSENAKKLSVGATGEQYQVIDGHVAIPVLITDAAAVQKVERGTNQVSMGYVCDTETEPGIYDGMNYDTRQRGIRYNHMAVVDVARAGPDARIRMDSGATLITEEESSMADKVTVKLDGLTYEAAPEVAKALEKAQERGDKAEADAATHKTTADKATARADAAEGEVKKIKDSIPSLVKARSSLERSASDILGKDAKLDGDDASIMKQVIVKVSPEAKLDGVSDDYLRARFDAAVESFGDNTDAAKRKALGLDVRDPKEQRADSTSAQERHRQRMLNGGADPATK